MRNAFIYIFCVVAFLTNSIAAQEGIATVKFKSPVAVKLLGVPEAYAQIEIFVSAKGTKAGENIDRHMPILINACIEIISNASSKQFAKGGTGIIDMRNDIRNSMNRDLRKYRGIAPQDFEITEVGFAQVIVQ
jgi:flagellar basal body-associated protein FliL